MKRGPAAVYGLSWLQELSTSVLPLTFSSRWQRIKWFKGRVKIYEAAIKLLIRLRTVSRQSESLKLKVSKSARVQSGGQDLGRNPSRNKSYCFISASAQTANCAESDLIEVWRHVFFPHTSNSTTGEPAHMVPQLKHRIICSDVLTRVLCLGRWSLKSIKYH